MRCKIIGTGSYLPQKIVTNDDLSKTIDTSDEWIKTRTGIRQRHIANSSNGETCSYMGTMAAKRALEMSGKSIDDIDLILVSTVTADYRLPTAACLIQEQLGAKNTPAFDIGAACAGSVYGLSIADSFIRSKKYKNILFIAAEALSTFINWQDRNTAVLFGDGASAAVLSTSADNDSGFIDFDLYADGSQQKTIWLEAGGSKCPIDEEVIGQKRNKLTMNGRETFKFAVRTMCDAVERITEKNSITAKDIDIVVPHQANLRIIEAIAKRMSIPMENFLVNLDKCANTSAASLLLAYDEASRANKIKPKDLTLMLAIGAGFVWGAALYKV